MKASIYLSIALLLILYYASYTASLPSKNQPLAASASSKIIMAIETNNESNTETTTNHITRYITIEFEVFGRVQGVFFRKYTKEKAEELGLTGWCRNTHRGTVKGEFEFAYSTAAENDNDNETDKESWEALAFQHWLCRVGSPRSRIDDCTFSEKKIAPSTARQYDVFRVIR